MAAPGRPPVGFPVARGGPAERETAPCGDFVEGIALAAMLALGQLGAQRETPASGEAGVMCHWLRGRATAFGEQA